MLIAVLRRAVLIKQEVRALSWNIMRDNQLQPAEASGLKNICKAD